MKNILQKPFKINTIVTVVALPKPSDQLFKFEREGIFNFACDSCALPTVDFGQNTYERFENGFIYTQILCDKCAADLEDTEVLN
jgi:hypothetical protein